MKNARLYSLCLIVFILSCRTLPPNHSSGTSFSREGDIDCELVIVGGGVAGLYTAYKLGPAMGPKICVFEKENRLGGRIYDVAKLDDHGEGPFIAVGGRRVVEGQKVLFDLAKELGIELQKPQIVHELGYARGVYSTNVDDFLKAYPSIPVNKEEGVFDGQLWEKLLDGPERKNIQKYPNFRSYAEAVVGKEGYRFLRDTYRFRADFDYDLSAKAYLEYVEEENNAGAICPSGACQTFYPVGGMSAFVRGLAEKSEGFGVRIFTSEPVVSVSRAKIGYTVTTSKRAVVTPKVVLAVPPYSLNKIGGDIVDKIRNQDQFKSLIGVRVTTIAQWYDVPWWKDVKAKDGKVVWRAWTTDSCINSVEFPQEQYAAQQNVIRSVYNDRLDCVLKWEQLAQGKPGELEEEIRRGLVHLFGDNKVTAPVTIGQPTKTVYWEWPDAWYFVKAGFPFSNQDIFNWAVEPLKGEDIALVSEGYNPQRSAWTDGAYKSSIHYLNKKFSLNLYSGK